jgi:hypothetical protein
VVEYPTFFSVLFAVEALRGAEVFFAVAGFLPVAVAAFLGCAGALALAGAAAFALAAGATVDLAFFWVAAGFSVDANVFFGLAAATLGAFAAGAFLVVGAAATFVVLTAGFLVAGAAFWWNNQTSIVLSNILIPSIITNLLGSTSLGLRSKLNLAGQTLGQDEVALLFTGLNSGVQAMVLCASSGVEIVSIHSILYTRTYYQCLVHG